MSTAEDRPAPESDPTPWSPPATRPVAGASRFAVPRPGVVTTLGILNVVFSMLALVCIFGSVMWIYGMSTMGATLQAKVEPGPPANPAGTPMLGRNPMMGMNNPGFLRFSLADSAAGLLVNLPMLASGVGLISLRRWGARLWYWLAWAKIVRLFLFWGFFIVAVAPSLSEDMGRSVAPMVPQGPRGPTAADFTRVYNVTNLFTAVGMIVFGSIYPAISIWLLGRPGVEAALLPNPGMEPELP